MHQPYRRRRQDFRHVIGHRTILWSYFPRTLSIWMEDASRWCRWWGSVDMRSFFFRNNSFPLSAPALDHGVNAAEDRWPCRQACIYQHMCLSLGDSRKEIKSSRLDRWEAHNSLRSGSFWPRLQISGGFPSLTTCCTLSPLVRLSKRGGFIVVKPFQEGWAVHVRMMQFPAFCLATHCRHRGLCDETFSWEEKLEWDRWLNDSIPPVVASCSNVVRTYYGNAITVWPIDVMEFVCSQFFASKAAACNGEAGNAYPNSWVLGNGLDFLLLMPSGSCRAVDDIAFLEVIFGFSYDPVDLLVA